MVFVLVGRQIHVKIAPLSTIRDSLRFADVPIVLLGEGEEREWETLG